MSSCVGPCLVNAVEAALRRRGPRPRPRGGSTSPGRCRTATSRLLTLAIARTPRWLLSSLALCPRPFCSGTFPSSFPCFLALVSLQCPGSKLSNTIAWWTTSHARHPTCRIGEPPPTSVRGDGLAAGPRNDREERARRHLAPESNPSRRALFDLSSSCGEGSHSPARRTSPATPTRKNGKGPDSELRAASTDPQGRPLATRVSKGNTADTRCPSTAIAGVRDTARSC